MAGFADATKYGIEADSGELRGNMYHIACSTWFTATGKAMPQYSSLRTIMAISKWLGIFW